MKDSQKVKVFICYKHSDIGYFRNLFNSIKSCPTVEIFSDFLIEAGTKWNSRIQKELDAAEIILLLLSQQFLDDKAYVKNVELKRAFERYERGECIVIPIYSRACDLSGHSQIEELQGLPSSLPDDKKFISDLKSKDSAYLSIRMKITNISSDLITKRNIARSISSNDPKSKDAIEIQRLEKSKKIFLSLPESGEGMRQRQEFLEYIDDKSKVEKWDYEIIPGKYEMQQYYRRDNIAKREFLLRSMKDSFCSIHVVANDNDFSNGQYGISKECEITFFHNTIIWFTNDQIKNSVGKQRITKSITGDDCSTFDEIIENIVLFDKRKEDEIILLKKTFSPKQVFLIYDHASDRYNTSRLEAQTKIEQCNISVIPNRPDLQDVDEDLEGCDGVFIFYGLADHRWFADRQNKIRKTSSGLVKAVFLDEPDINIKRGDVIKGDFQTIEGREASIGIEIFVTKILNAHA